MDKGTVEEALLGILQSQLKEINSEHEAPWILQWIHRQKPKTLEDCVALMTDVIDRRKKEEPLAYIFGEWAFRDLELFVGPGVLIPRPETEELVELVLETISAEANLPETLYVADLGAGSGAIGIALALDLPHRTPGNFDITLVERSEVAREYLRKNLKKYSPFLRSKIGLYPGSWVDWAQDEKDSSLDLIVSNPPYIPDHEWEKLDHGVRHFEPAEALKPAQDSADPHALVCYREILELSARLLKPNAWGFFEMGAQAPEVLELIQQNPALKKGQIHFDIAGKKRFISFRRV